MFYEIPITKQAIANRHSIMNIGLNDAPYITQIKIKGVSFVCPFHKTWRNMLLRVYSKAYQSRQSTYIGTTVCKEWLLFTNFKAWMQTQNWENNQLDKDIRVKGNKHYSPNTCLFVSQHINSLLRPHDRTAKGIYEDKTNPNNIRYVVHRVINGKSKHLEQYNTRQKAEIVSYKCKRDLLLNIAEIEIDNTIKLHLIKEAKYYNSNLIQRS